MNDPLKIAARTLNSDSPRDSVRDSLSLESKIDTWAAGCFDVVVAGKVYRAEMLHRQRRLTMKTRRLEQAFKRIEQILSPPVWPEHYWSPSEHYEQVSLLAMLATGKDAILTHMRELRSTVGSIARAKARERQSILVELIDAICATQHVSRDAALRQFAARVCTVWLALNQCIGFVRCQQCGEQTRIKRPQGSAWKAWRCRYCKDERKAPANAAVQPPINSPSQYRELWGTRISPKTLVGDRIEILTDRFKKQDQRGQKNR